MFVLFVSFALPFFSLPPFMTSLITTVGEWRRKLFEEVLPPCSRVMTLQKLEVSALRSCMSLRHVVPRDILIIIWHVSRPHRVVYRFFFPLPPVTGFSAACPSSRICANNLVLEVNDSPQYPHCGFHLSQYTTRKLQRNQRTEISCCVCAAAAFLARFAFAFPTFLPCAGSSTDRF